MIRLAVAALLILLLSAQAAIADSCPRLTTPGKFDNPKGWGTDSGVVIDGFGDLANADGAKYVVTHGTDVSSNNLLHYADVAGCGGQFAFLRVDARFADHRAGFAAQNITTIPYYYFSIPKALRARSLYGKEDEQAYLAKFAVIGTDAAKTFDARYGFGSLAVASIANFKGALLSLDIEEKFVDEDKSSAVQRAHYGRYYARAVCSFIAYAKSKRPEVATILYTTPSVYADYLDKALAEDNACLQQLPVWMARTTVDGGDVIRSSNNTADKQAQRTCLLTGGNRCIIHQYSHRGMFAALGQPVNGHKPHIDLDRFFDTVWVVNESGGQYVRSGALE